MCVMVTNNADFIFINASFPHIGKRMALTWGYPEFLQLVHELLHDTRGGVRRGFPLNALAAIHRLDDLHRQRFPQYYKFCVWDGQ